MMEDKYNLKHGHRQRLIERFLEKDENSLFLYEIVELCLIITIPRKNVADISKMLCRKYRSLSQICDSSQEELLKIEGIGLYSVLFFKLLAKLIRLTLKEQLSSTIIFSNSNILKEYCKIRIQNFSVEHMLVLFLNSKGELMEEELFYEGTKNFVNAYPREIVKRALNLGADFIVLAHNHPSGNNNPSSNDISTTNKISELCKNFNILLYDHFIVSKSGCFSMRSAGYIQHENNI